MSHTIAEDLFISDSESEAPPQPPPHKLKSSSSKRSRGGSIERPTPSSSKARVEEADSENEEAAPPPKVKSSSKPSKRSTEASIERPTPSTSRAHVEETSENEYGTPPPKPKSSKPSSKRARGTSSERSVPAASSSNKETRFNDPLTSCAPKKAKKTPLIKPISSVMKPSVSDLFGSDSEEDMPIEAEKKVQLPASYKTEINKSIKCDKCNVDIPNNKYQYHMRTNIHKKNCLLKTDFRNINIIATAFRNRIVTYRINPSQEVEQLTPESFLCDMKNDVLKVIQLSLLKHTCIKLNFELFATFWLPQSGVQQMKSFNTKYDCVFNNNDTDELYSCAIETFKQKLSEFEHCESGWSFVSVNHLEININKYNPMRGGTFIELPSKIKNIKCCLNIRNKDEHCFLWSVVAALYPASSNVCKTASYPHYSTMLKTAGMNFPPSCKDIQLFEDKNDISINIYGLDKKDIVTGPLYLTKYRKSKHVNLLYIEREGKAHYCLIKNLLLLVRRQFTKSRSKIFMCEACLQFFTSENKYTSHSCSQVRTELPKEKSTLRFKHFDRKQKINFVIYADFESLLVNCTEENTKNKNTRNLKVHQPSCFAYYICCSHDSSLNKFVSYRGLDCVEVFIKRLIDDVKRLHKILNVKNPMTPLTQKQQHSFQNATVCHICNNLLFDDKVRDHDHVKSEYRGAAHSHCNLMFKVCSFIPVIFHNLTNYDSHLFIRELAKYNGPLTVIPKTKEKYLTITKHIPLSSNLEDSAQIKFIDSFHFLSSSLDSLSKSLSDEDYVHLSMMFQKDELRLLKNKGIYPYDYMDSWEKYNETSLPSKKNFYNALKSKHVSETEYIHAQSVWKHFNIHSLGAYTDLYLKCDVLLLCDIFENFRNISLKHYKLDPAYYITSPSLSWDAMLLSTGIQLDLIDDLEMYQMLERGIRGGLVQCSVRHAKANNKYLQDFDDIKPPSYLVYLDCNNLYGHAMTRSLPYSEFRFLSKDEIKKFDISKITENSDFGFVLDVNLGYLENLHDLHSELPFAPEKFVPPGGKSPKLIANLYDKYNYVIHYIYLKECLKNGMILKNIHRILTFRQSNYLQKYIDLNTCLRQNSSTAFEKDFFKLMNNAIFGKTIENKRKQVEVKLITKWNDTENITNKIVGAEKLIAKPNLKNISVFSDDFLAIQLNPEKIVLDRPIYIGFTVLEYAKQHLYRFHYDFIKNKYKENAILCYTDTDSLLYLFFTDDIYCDIKNHPSVFDTSNFDLNNPYLIERKNAKTPGLFKDELGGDIITEFAGLRSKLYGIQSIKTRINKAKGVAKCITDKLTLLDYKNSLFNGDTLKCEMNLIKSIKHVLYSQVVDKTVLNSDDDKRQILANRVDTLPWGHFKTIF